jgi:hypothetical protein
MHAILWPMQARASPNIEVSGPVLDVIVLGWISFL